jgi:tetratricopeptide (TPR) repeat protein
MAVASVAAALAAGIMVFMAARQTQAPVAGQRASSPLDVLAPDERALYELVERSVVAPIEGWLPPPERPAPGEKADKRKRLLAEFEARASAANIPANDFEARLASMGAKVRSLPGMREDTAAVAALAAGDFEALREPREGSPVAWRVWLAVGKAHLAGWEIPDAAKAMRRAIALWPADANPEWKRSVIIIYARSLGWLERFAESEALLRANGPRPDGAIWPDAEAGLWANELANQLHAQGKFIEAETEMRRVLELAEKTHGLVHANVATAAANLAYLVARRGNLEEGALLILRAEAIAEKTIPPADHRNVEWALFHGNLLVKQDKPAEAAAVLDRALVRAQAQYGEEHFLVIQLRQALAECARRSGQRGTADRLEKEALADLNDLIRENDPARAGVLSAQGRALVQRGDLAGAERLFRRAVELLEKGGAPTERGAAYVDLCGTLLRLGRVAEARPLLERAVAKTESARGESAPELIQLLQLLAVMRGQEGKPAAARMLFDRAISIAEKNSGKDSIPALSLLVEAAGFEQTQGRHAEAEKLFRRILDGVRKLSGPHSRDSINIRFQLIRCIQEQGRPAEVLPVIEEALKDADAVFAPNDPELIDYLTRAARVYQNLRRDADAKPLARRALDIAIATRGEDHPDTANAAATLATSLFAQGADDEAGKLLRTAVAIAGKNRERMHPEIPNWFMDLARICVAKGALNDAESLSRAALAIFEQQVPADHPLLVIPLARLADVLAVRGRPAEAEPLLRRALTIASAGLGAASPVPEVVASLRTAYGASLRAQGVGEKQIESRIRATLPRAK